MNIDTCAGIHVYVYKFTQICDFRNLLQYQGSQTFINSPHSVNCLHILLFNVLYKESRHQMNKKM
jgi:hypothetical protein